MLLTLLGLATLVMGAKDVAAIATMLTLGLGAFAVVGLVNATVYGLVALPFVVGISLKRRMSVILGALVSLAAAFFVLVQPSLQADRDVAAALERLTATDQVIEIANADIAGVELNLFNNFNGDAPCNDICRGILMGGYADWVRVVFANDGQGNRAVRRYGMASGDVCGAAETCLQLIEPSDRAADLVITRARITPDSHEFGLKPRLARFAKGQRLEIVDTRTAARLFHETFPDYEKVTRPVFWTPKFQQLNSDGYELHRKSYQPNITSIAAALSLIGLDVVPVASPLREAGKPYAKLPTTVETSAVQAILATPAGAPFAPADQAALRDYVDKVRWFPEGGLPDLHRDTVFALFQESRFEEGWALDQVLSKDVELSAQVLPWMMDALEGDTPLAERTIRSFQSVLRGGYDETELAPFAAQFLRVLAGLPDDAPDSWFSPIGRFATDPLLYLDAVDRSGTNGVTRT